MVPFKKSIHAVYAFIPGVLQPGGPWLTLTSSASSTSTSTESSSTSESTSSTPQPTLLTSPSTSSQQISTLTSFTTISISTSPPPPLTTLPSTSASSILSTPTPISTPTSSMASSTLSPQPSTSNAASQSYRTNISVIAGGVIGGVVGGVLVAIFLFWLYTRCKSSHLVARTSSQMDERKMLPSKSAPVAQTPPQSSEREMASSPPPSIWSSTQPVSQPAPQNPFVSIISLVKRDADANPVGSGRYTYLQYYPTARQSQGRVDARIVLQYGNILGSSWTILSWCA